MTAVTDTKGLLGEALAAMRGTQDTCEHHSETCTQQGWQISQDWADAAMMPRLHLCEAHRAEFHETFLG